MCRILLIMALYLCCLGISAQDENLGKYHRSSLYSILLKHSEKQYCNEMIEAFNSIPIPDKYNNHDLKIKIMPAPVIKALTKTEIEGGYKDAITKLLTKNKIGGRLVEKWFDRDKQTGAFDMNLIEERGYYDASILDVKEALSTVRGAAMLADAGEELLNHTYVLVNDIRYADKETMKTAVGAGLVAAQLAGDLFGVDLSGSTEFVGGIVGDIAGFRVLVTSYLFKLVWNDDVASDFYGNYYIDANALDNAKREAFNADLGKFKLKYIGSATVYSGKTALGGVKSEKDMFLKVCTRAVDKSISELQKSFDEFKVFTPLISTEPLCAYIGMKEGVDEDSRFEVLEKTLDEDGRTKYEKVGEIKPEKGHVWDNRFMAADDEEAGAELKYTTFKKVSGKDFFPGMLIREIR